VAITGPYIPVRAFARFDNTLSVIEKSSALTLSVAGTSLCLIGAIELLSSDSVQIQLLQATSTA
jgi:hypothetical protein